MARHRSVHLIKAAQVAGEHVTARERHRLERYSRALWRSIDRLSGGVFEKALPSFRRDGNERRDYFRELRQRVREGTSETLTLIIRELMLVARIGELNNATIVGQNRTLRRAVARLRKENRKRSARARPVLTAHAQQVNQAIADNGLSSVAEACRALLMQQERWKSLTREERRKAVERERKRYYAGGGRSAK